MSVAKLSRDHKRQLGQFLTPDSTAAEIMRNIRLTPKSRVLEPSFGQGSFVFQVIDLMASQLPKVELRTWCESHLFGCELDPFAYEMFGRAWEMRGLGTVPRSLERCDFFRWMPPGCDRYASTHRQRYFASKLEHFDLIIGNPPFGGSIDPDIQDELDAIFGMRNGKKIKKETYAFFIVKSVDLLRPGGQLVFICSDTILTIATMTGLRSWLQSTCEVQISAVPGSFPDTNQDMLLVSLTKQGASPTYVTVFGQQIPVARIESTPNMSWRVNAELAKYFSGVTVGEKMVATSGMTIGNNDLFLRQIKQGVIEEPYEFSYGQQKITVERELARARLGKVGTRRLREVKELEACGATEKMVIWNSLDTPKRIALPHQDYRHYNKATSRIVYANPHWVIFWRDNGEYVYTFKKTGNWYLHGVGGMKYFCREGITWALIAPRLYTRYLPSGYILDSGAPCAFLRPNVEHDEIFLVLAWTLTDLCSHVLKEVINHTRNIQSKDFERLPYPVWIDEESRQRAISAAKKLVERAKGGDVFSFQSPEVRNLNRLFEWRNCQYAVNESGEQPLRQLALF